VFRPDQAAFSIHAEGCPVLGKRPASIYTLPEAFASVGGARLYADADESARAGRPALATVRVCRCAKEST
jgi:hypothetical protein